MPEKKRFGNPGGFGQLARRRAREPFAREQRHRRIDNGLAAFVAIEAGGSHDAPESKRSLTWGQDIRAAANNGAKSWAASPRRPPNQRCGNGRLPPYPAAMR